VTDNGGSNWRDLAVKLAKPVLIAMILALLAYLGVTYPTPVGPLLGEEGVLTVAGTTHFTNLQAQDLTATDDVVVYDDLLVLDTGTFTNVVATDLTASGDLTVLDDVFITDDVVADSLVLTTTLSVGTKMKLTAGSVVTCTNGTGGCAPTSSYQPVTAAGAVGATIATTGWSAGQMLVMVNTGTNAITITDTGTTMLSGNIALGQYDSLWLIFDGTNWIMLGTSNN